MTVSNTLAANCTFKYSITFYNAKYSTKTQKSAKNTIERNVSGHYLYNSSCLLSTWKEQYDSSVHLLYTYDIYNFATTYK